MGRALFNPESYWKTRHSRDELGIRKVGNICKSRDENVTEYRRAQGQMANYLEDDVGDISKASILDLGFGMGHYAGLARRLGAAFYHGLDFASKDIDALTGKYSGLKFENRDICEPGLDLGRKYDVILLIDVAYHIVDERKFRSLIDNVRRHVRARSVIYVTGRFKNGTPTAAHVSHRELSRFEGLTSLGTVKGPERWRDNSIVRIIVENAPGL
ncbi:MAG: class I SAM-dependent methyltransferase [Candidatus Nitrospinota bacterium M3_3B_026]